MLGLWTDLWPKLLRTGGWSMHAQESTGARTSDGSLEAAFALTSGVAKVLGDVMALPMYNLSPILAFAALGAACLLVAWALAREIARAA